MLFKHFVLVLAFTNVDCIPLLVVNAISEGNAMYSGMYLNVQKDQTHTSVLEALDLINHLILSSRFN